MCVGHLFGFPWHFKHRVVVKSKMSDFGKAQLVCKVTMMIFIPTVCKQAVPFQVSSTVCHLEIQLSTGHFGSSLSLGVVSFFCKKSLHVSACSLPYLRKLGAPILWHTIQDQNPLNPH